jgi:rubrerythrin
MDKHDASEQAYKNGYSAGYEAGRRSVGRKSWRCKWCDGEYNTKIMATAIRYHTNGNMDGYELPVKYCPNCGADMRGEEDG